jgi:uncharacterized protein (TIGR03067 family)
MRNVAVLLGSVLFLVNLAFAQDEAAKDLKRMEGTWSATILEIAGRPTTDEEKKQVKISVVIEGNKYRTLVDDKQVDHGTIKLDPTKKPKTIDAMPEEGPHKGKTLAGSYHLEGDEMKIVFDDPGKDRPTEFKTREGTGQVLAHYKRVKK